MVIINMMIEALQRPQTSQALKTLLAQNLALMPSSHAKMSKIIATDKSSQIRASYLIYLEALLESIIDTQDRQKVIGEEITVMKAFAQDWVLSLRLYMAKIAKKHEITHILDLMRSKMQD